MTLADYDRMMARIRQPLLDHVFHCWPCGTTPNPAITGDLGDRFRICKVGHEVWWTYVNRLSRLNKVYWGRFCCRCPEHYPCSHEKAFTCSVELDYAERTVFAPVPPRTIRR